ncbi:MAG: hypothetical protein ACHQF0_04900 [Chitinophagales bacterium]
MNLKLLFGSVLLSIIIFSCKKTNSISTTPPPPPVDTMITTPKDTLAAGWSKTVLSDSPVFVDIFFMNNTGFAMTSSSIYKSINGGTTWTKIFSGGTNIINMGMGSETNAAFAAHPNTIISTQDAGVGFNTIAVSDVLISDVFFVDSLTAYAAGKSIWETNDAGLHWAKIYEFPNQGNYQTLYFLNEQTGWVIRTDGLYNTTDSGLTWQLVNEGNQVNVSQAGVVFFTNTSHGFISDLNIIAATTDGGSTWNKIYSATSDTYHDLHFLNDNIGYVTDGQYILKTVNGGSTWTKEATVPGIIFYEIHFTDANHGWACGSGGVILKYEK